MGATEASVCMSPTMFNCPTGPQQEETGKKHQGKCPALVSPLTPTKLCCLCLLTIVLPATVLGLSIALSGREPEQVIRTPSYAASPRNWTGFGNKCFYFSEDTRNWTHSQAFCKEFGAELTQFENLEELNFLRRHIDTFDHWIGLHRESSRQPWKWTDHTEYSSLAPIRGVGEYAYLNINGISSARGYADRKWICSKPNSTNFQCQTPPNSFQNVTKML